MSLRGQPSPQQPDQTHLPPPRHGPADEVYNVIPVHDTLVDHPVRRYPEVRAACHALCSIGELWMPPSKRWLPQYDLLDWLALFFGFQKDNVRNQREHLVLHLANLQMRLGNSGETLDTAVIRSFRKKLLKNYTDWCSYLGRTSSIWISDDRESVYEPRRELLYVSLWLLIWGESANLRFVPECICYIFHNMTKELNDILEGCLDADTALPALPSTYEPENAFLNRVVTPIYNTIRAEVELSKNGTAPHSVWRNYDDINEYFWSNRCFERLKWPIQLGSNFLATGGISNRVGKTGFVEQRSFLNLFRSFDRLWVMLVLFLQAAIFVAWQEKEYPWQALKSRDVQVRVLTVFITWSGMRFLQSLLDMVMPYRLISRETVSLGVRMFLKIVVSAVWVITFVALYKRIWSQKSSDNRWSPAANRKIVNFLKAGLVFVVPELLAVVLFIVPWIRNFLEETNWNVFRILTWWFQSRTFVGRGLRAGLTDNVKYSLFWLLVLITKFSFSYFLQIKPMIRPSKQLLHLPDVQYCWPQFFSDSNRFAVGLLWLPVVLIYLMDLQIWYTFYSSFVGTAVGLLEHLGEIQNMQQSRLRFQFLASAVHFNLFPEEKLLNERRRATSGNMFGEFISRVKLRCGLGRPYKEFEPNQTETHKLALLWNEVIKTFREEDIISDHEVELLEFLELRNSWSVRVTRWPCLLLCNEVQVALRQTKLLVDAPDSRLWHKISKHEYRRCAVIEAYDSVTCLLLQIITTRSGEHSIVSTLFQEIDRAIEFEKFTKSFKLKGMPRIHDKLTKLVKLLIKPEKDEKYMNEVVNAVQALYATVMRDFS